MKVSKHKMAIIPHKWLWCNNVGLKKTKLIHQNNCDSLVSHDFFLTACVSLNLDSKMCACFDKLSSSFYYSCLYVVLSSWTGMLLFEDEIPTYKCLNLLLKPTV